MDAQGKGLWSDVVRGKEAITVTSLADGIREQLVLSEAISETEDDSKTCGTSQEASTTSLLDGEGTDSSAVCNGDRETNAEGIAESPVGEGKSPQTSIKSAWKKPDKSLIDPHDGAVMGSESWPSLADSLTMRPAKSSTYDSFHNPFNEKSEKDLSPATVFLSQENTDGRNRPGDAQVRQRIIESRKQGDNASTSVGVSSLFPDFLPPAAVHVDRSEEHRMHVTRAGNSSSVDRGHISNQRTNTTHTFDHSLTSQRFRSEGIASRGGGSHRQRYDHGYSSAPGGMYNPRFNYARHSAPYQRGTGGPTHSSFGNRRPFRGQGRGNHHWSPEGSYAEGPNHLQPFQQPILYPRNFLWNVPPVFHPSFGYVNYPVPEGMYYSPITSPSFPHGAGYYVSPEVPFFPPPAFQDNSPLSLLAKQIEYYFSDENLVKDVFLRSNMDDEGFVPASLIASFNLIKSKNADTNMILESLQKSVVVEVKGDKLRKRYSWPFWLPTNQDKSSESVSKIGESAVDVAPQAPPQLENESEH